MTASQAFFQLDERIQRFLWVEQWEELRDVQELAIPLILPGDRDVLIAAATAAGKTEAAFLPALTHMLAKETPSLVVYISPLKALINDQFGRLERLCESLEIPVWPWHGDISATLKTRFHRARRGVLLITPESLEAMLCNRGSAVGSIFGCISFFVIDELHAFIGNERGKQLQSLMHRIESVLARRVPRVALSATLGDMQIAARFLRTDSNVSLVVAAATCATLKILVRGFEEPSNPADQLGQETTERAPIEIAKDLYRTLRGSNNLVFPNSRREVELYTHLLREQSDQAHVANEFWPHHGNLSREIRTDTEAALKRKDRPATAICTNTLELGIDIGHVRSVTQIGTPPTVASLRQRMGRSGRRKGEPAILRGFVIEGAIDAQASLATRLRLDTVQMAASISLLIEGWFEPPAAHGLHLSTLIQQLLSAIAQHGGLHAGTAFRLLCGPDAPFNGLSKRDFAALLSHLGSIELLTQDSSGLLLHGRLGDKFVNHYTFYAAFMGDEEFRVVAGGKTLGTLPVDQLLTVGQRILFAGRTWLVEDIDDTQKAIYVSPAKGGAPPLFSGSGGRVHTRVRQRMRELYASDAVLPYLDPMAQRHLEQGRSSYREISLFERWLIDQGSTGLIVTWLGDNANEALACMLQRQGVPSSIGRLGVEFEKKERTLDEILDLLGDIGSEVIPSTDELLADAKNLQREKWDWALPAELLRRSYESSSLDVAEARLWLARPSMVPPSSTGALNI